MLRCRDIVEQADAYLATELTSWQRLQFQMHLAICRNCRRYLRALRATQFVSLQIPQQQTPDSRIDALVLMIQQDHPKTPD